MQIHSGHLRSFFRRYGLSLCVKVALLIVEMQLPDLHAPTHSFKVLAQAMQETIAHINELTEQAGITEVRLQVNGVMVHSYNSFCSRVF